VHRQLVHALRERIDWEPERRRLRPHITVARMRAGSAPRERTLEATPALSFAAASLTLYRSWLSSAGAEYQPLAQAML
jgi:2'-5' RNA ligase